MLRLIACLLLFIAGPLHAQGKPPLVLAAASLQESLTAAADAWAKKGHARPVISFAASSALARQIEAGAPADLFVSADEAWMDKVEGLGKVRPGTRQTFLWGRLVLIAPADDGKFRVQIRPGFPLAQRLGGGRLAMADPNAVPAGKYGKAALASLGVWDQVAPKVVSAENVRAALALVARGEAVAGIVYETDAKAEPKVRVVGYFPAGSHPAITYPVATLTSAASADAEPFRLFLLSGEGKAIFRRFGFRTR